MSYKHFNDMIEKDIDLLWTIQDYCYRNDWLNNLLSRIVSKHPWKDIGMIIWIFFIIGVIELKAQHFFPVVMNLITAFIIRFFLEAKRPVEYDIRLQPLTDTGATSFGFPSLESYMSVVIMGHLFIHIKSWQIQFLFFPVVIFIVFIVGFSRIYSRSRFPHQVLGSWFFGLIGLIIGHNTCEHMSFHKMSHGHHWACVAYAIIPIMLNFALSMENNDSRLLNIPKQEFIRVLRDIISNSEDSNVDDTIVGEYNGELRRREVRSDGNRSRETPRSAAIRKLANMNTERMRQKGRIEVKRDSFYFLQKTLESRNEEIKTARSNLNSGGYPTFIPNSSRSKFSDTGQSSTNFENDNYKVYNAT